MIVLYIAFSAILGSTLFVQTRTEHHEIPILSNNSVINNSYNITSFINLTSLLDIDNDRDLEESESYDEGVALMEDYSEEENVSLDDENYVHSNDTLTDALEQQEDEEDSDFEFLATRGRWSYAPGFVERMCRGECQQAGKPFGRLLGTRCQCYCPLNAPTLDLCSTSRACDNYCSSIGYAKGGNCVYNNVCFCYCRKSDKYDVRQVHTA